MARKFDTGDEVIATNGVQVPGTSDKPHTASFAVMAGMIGKVQACSSKKVTVRLSRPSGGFTDVRTDLDVWARLDDVYPGWAERYRRVVTKSIKIPSVEEIKQAAVKATDKVIPFEVDVRKDGLKLTVETKARQLAFTEWRLEFIKQLCEATGIPEELVNDDGRRSSRTYGCGPTKKEN